MDGGRLRMPTDKPVSQPGEVDQFWKFLDNLAESDPVQYEKFIQQQLKQNAPASLLNKSDIQHQFDVITTTDSRPTTVRFSADQSATEPQSSVSDERIPIKLGKSNKSKDFWSVLFHPKVFSRMASQPRYQSFVIELALQNIEAESHQTISRDLKLRPVEAKVKSQASPKIILPFESKITAAENATSPTESHERHRESSVSSKPLVEIIQQTPVYTIKEEVNDTARKLLICIELPLLSSISDVNLDMSSREMVLENTDYFLKLSLESEIELDSVKAKFSKRKHTLSVSALIQS